MAQLIFIRCPRSTKFAHPYTQNQHQSFDKYNSLATRVPPSFPHHAPTGLIFFTENGLRPRSPAARSPYLLPNPAMNDFGHRGSLLFSSQLIKISWTLLMFKYPTPNPGLSKNHKQTGTEGGVEEGTGGDGFE